MCTGVLDPIINVDSPIEKAGNYGTCRKSPQKLTDLWCDSFEEKNKQAGAELGQAQVKLDDIVVIVVEVKVVVNAMVEVEVQLLFRVGGWVVG